MSSQAPQRLRQPAYGYDNRQPQQIAAPQPGYAIPASIARPAPVADTGRPSPNLQVQTSGYPHPPSSPAPSTPHHLEMPITPIQASFARPPRQQRDPEKVTFGKDSIIRGVSEENLLPGRGEKGDDFWRRFSMVAKEEPKTRESSWLKKTQNGTSRLSKWVWIIGMGLLILIVGAACIGYYSTRSKPDNARTESIGGGENKFAVASDEVKGTGTAVQRVTPTHTVARRADLSEPVPTPPTTEFIRRMHSEAARRKRSLY